MDQAESPTIVRGRGRNKRKWTWDEDEELVKALCEVSLDPRFRVQGGGFKNCYSQGIESLLAQKLPGRGIKASPHVDSRLKVLKCKFYSIKDMLASPGFSWDGSRKVVRCEKERYDEYCKDNPRAKGLNGIPFPHFDAFDAIYGKDRTAREGMEVSEEAAANLENGNTSEGGDGEPEEDRMSAGPSGRSLDAASSYEKPKKCKYGGKRKKIESNCPSLDMLKDVRGHYQGASQHVDTMAEAVALFKDVHRHFQNVVQHASSMAAAMETFKDAYTQFQSVVQNVSITTSAMERFKDAHDHFRSTTQSASTAAAVTECRTDLQEKLAPEVPQQNARVRAIAEMQKLGFTGSQVVDAATVFAREPNQMGMFLALPEIYRREYIQRMLNGGQSLQF
ncbi:uncharacterized protein LOC124679067 [Lolium rigidum]|uniref:uncharacterized protein LOC124679067 n=1 Tax=Lolium rigidum TaxID=89674 RepID=UPI001F5CC97E|nr:uncharacterized protein LOC124679067 [Lolium rigidum]